MAAYAEMLLCAAPRPAACAAGAQQCASSSGSDPAGFDQFRSGGSRWAGRDERNGAAAARAGSGVPGGGGVAERAARELVAAAEARWALRENGHYIDDITAVVVLLEEASPPVASSL